MIGDLLGRQATARIAVALGLVGAAAWPSAAAADPPADTIFGYEAGANSRLLEYSIDRRTSTVAFRRACVPNPGENGRGVALDARQGPDQPAPGGANTQTRVLYNTFEHGDGFIHRNTLPVDGCQPLQPIPFGEGPGGPNQDDIGALDFDDTDDGGRGKGQDADILYAAGYLARSQSGQGLGNSQFLFKVNAENGNILGRCQAPTRTPTFGGNDTLTFARLKLGPNGQVEEVLLTDFGEFRGMLAPDSLAAVDVDSLTGPPAPAPAPPCQILAEFPAPASNAGSCCTGADYEKIPKPQGETGRPDSLVVTNLTAFFDANQPPFSPARPMGSAAPSTDVEDISVDRINPPEDRP